MCLAVYVGSAVELPVRPWAKHPGEFNVEALGDRPGHDEVRRRLQKPFVYNVGAHTDCACGFTRQTTDDDQLVGWTRSIESLTSWLTNAVESGPLDVLVCEQGDEATKPARRTIKADAISEVDFRSAHFHPLRLRVHG